MAASSFRFSFDPSIAEDNHARFEEVFDDCYFRPQRGEKWTAKQGENRAWIIDTRQGLAASENLQFVADYFIDILDRKEINQVVVKGYGAYLFVGSVLVSSHSPITAGIVREEQKGSDRNKLIEGSLDPTKPVLLLDDIINSGNSTISAIKDLKSYGFKTINISCAFLMEFTWGKGCMRIGQQGIPVSQIFKAMEVNAN